jgi:hypothetical protein
MADVTHRVFVRLLATFAIVWLAASAPNAIGQTPPNKAFVAIRPDIEKVTEGLRLAEGWRFKAGDDPSWSNPALDDSGWGMIFDTSLIRYQNIAGSRDKQINPRAASEGTSQFIYSQDWDGVAWFRLRFDVDPSLAGKIFLLDIGQSGASEIYLNGVRLARFGVIGGKDKEQAFDAVGSPVVLSFARGGEHVLAIRYSCRAARSLNRGFDGLPEITPRGIGFVARLRPLPVAPYTPVMRNVVATVVLLAFAGILVGIALVHLFAGRGIADSKLHRLLSLFAALAAVLTFVRFLMVAGHLGVGTHAYLSLLYYLLIVLCGLSFTAFMHEVLTPADPHLHLALGITSVFVTGAAAAFPEIIDIYLIGVLIALLCIYLRMAVIIVRGKARKAQGWGIFLAALVALMLPLAWMLLDSAGVVPPRTTDFALSASLAIAGLLGSLFLIREFVRDIIDAEDKLRDLRERYDKMFSMSDEGSGTARPRKATADR